MKVVLTQLNIGSKFRFMPSGANGTYISNKPRDGWLTEAAARKWAEKNGHEIVKVEKAAGKGEKIYNIEYTYKDRFGKTKTFTSALVGKDVEPLKKRIFEGLTRNGDKLISFGKITTKDSAEDSIVQHIADKYAINDGFLQADKDWRRKVTSYIKTKWRLPDSYLNRFIRDFDRDLGDLFKQNESWEKVTRWIDGRVRKIDVNPYSNSYKHSLIALRMKEPGKKGSALKKDSAEMDADEKFFFEVLSRNGRVISRIKAPETISKAIAFRLADQESAKFKKPWAKCRIVDSKGKTFETYNRNFKTNEFVFKNMDASDDSSLVSRIAEKYALDAIGAGVVVPSFKAKTDVFKRLSQGNGPNDYNKAKKGLLDIVETIKKEIERQKSRNIPQKQKDEILKRLNKELEEAKQSIELYKKGRNIQPQTTKQWNRAMLRKDSADEFENDVMTYPVKSNRNGSKYGFIEKICKTKAEAEALVESLKKKGLVASYKGVIYRDSSDTMERIKAKYCLDGVGYSYADLKTALALGDIKPNQRMVSSVGGGMAKTAKEWLDMGMKVVNANKPYPLDKLKKR